MPPCDLAPTGASLLPNPARYAGQNPYVEYSTNSIYMESIITIMHDSRMVEFSAQTGTIFAAKPHVYNINRICLKYDSKQVNIMPYITSPEFTCKINYYARDINAGYYIV
jgi:hypothetical protein